MIEGAPRPTELLVPKNPEKVQLALDKLEQGFDDITNGDKFRSYLETLAKFHNYSPNNVMLIRLQRPDAQRVAGYNTWLDLKRQVRKGEKGITIITPRLARVDDPDTGQKVERLVGFGTGTVFDISQTEGKELPTPPGAFTLRTESEISKAIYRDLSDLSLDSGVPSVTRQAYQTLNGANGTYSLLDHRIEISDELRSDAAAKTLAHEFAHYTAGHRGRGNLPDMETVAEASAFVVMHAQGVDTGSYSFPYLAGWARDKEVLMRNLSAVQKTSHDVISGLERIREKPPKTSIVLFTR